MITLPYIATVADLQRRYRFLVSNLKKSNSPMVIVSNGKPDVVMMDVKVYNNQAVRLKELEEEYFLALARAGVEEYKKGKTVKLRKGQKLLDLVK